MILYQMVRADTVRSPLPSTSYFSYSASNSGP